MRIILIVLLNFLIFCLSGQTNLSAFVKKISQEFNVSVAIDPSLLNDESFKINETPKSIEDIYGVLTKAGLDYYLISDNILLLRKSATPSKVNTKTIKGKITDLVTKEPIPFASIYLTDYSNGTTTDENGNFSLEIKSTEGSIPIEASYLGYEKQVFNNKSLSTLDIVLKPKEDEIKEIVIIASPIQKIDVAQVLSQSEFNSYKLYKINSNDLIKTIQLSIPGVIRTNNAQVMIRSMKQDKTLSLVNNIPILKSGHYFNIISSLNELYFNEIDVYKNIFPSQYGNALGGMIRYTSNFDSNKSSIQTSTNLLYSGFAASINEKKLSFSIGARKSYIDFNKKGLFSKNFFQLKTPATSGQGIVTNIPDVAFFDINTQIKYNYSKKGNLTINGLINSDFNKLNWESQSQFFLGNQSLEIDQKFKNLENNKSVAIGAQNVLRLSDKINWVVDAHIYEYKDSFGLESNKTEIFNEKKKVFNDLYFQKQKITTKAISSLFELKLNEKNSINSGLFVKKIDLVFSGKENEKNVIELTEQANQYSLFGEYNISTENKEIKLGSKATKYSYFKKVYIEPYASFNQKLHQNISVKSTYAYRTQNLNLLDFETRFAQNLNYYYLSNDSLPLQTGHHFMIGSKYEKDNFSFDVEAYTYINKGNLLFTNTVTGIKKGPDGPMSNNGRYKLFSGINNIVGIDVMLNYKYQSWSSNINYTISKSTQKFEGIYKNQEVPSPNDRRHIFNFNNNYSLHRLTIGTSFSLMSGTPYISYKVAKSDAPKNSLARKDVIEYLPSFLSLDLSTDYALILKPVKINIGLSVSNITNNYNVKFVQQTGSFENKQGEKAIVTGNESQMPGRFFNFHIKTKF
jgi:ferric enterobactin receptor